nr:MAG TPA: hypothetical protein [Caudoviricetes sp.]
MKKATSFHVRLNHHTLCETFTIPLCVFCPADAYGRGIHGLIRY